MTGMGISPIPFTVKHIALSTNPPDHIAFTDASDTHSYTCIWDNISYSHCWPLSLLEMPIGLRNSLPYIK